jgi:uncharacterized protein YggE
MDGDRQPVISVRGEATLEVEPEIAVVGVSVQARDRDRRATLDRLARRNRQVLELVKAYGEAIEKLESDPARVFPEFKDGKPGERVTGYLGRAGVSVTVRDFTVLGDLMTKVADEELVSVSGPAWLLRPGSPVHREARLAAARDAMQRAREYAEAFGGTITGLVEVADTGLMTEAPEHGVRHVRAAAAMAAHAPAPLDFEPARRIVRAQVEARFTMTQPRRPGGD